MAEQEKEEEQQIKDLIIETVIQHFPDHLSGLHRDNFGIDPISTGKTNRSFKVYLRFNPAEPLYFAKLAFQHALWHPSSRNKNNKGGDDDDNDGSPIYDLQRTEVEFQSMKRFGEIMEEKNKNRNENNNQHAPVVPTPFFVADVLNGTAKLLVTEWVVVADNEFGRQYIQGQVDVRVVRKVAQALATLNATPAPASDWNGTIHSYFSAALPLFTAAFAKLVVVVTPDDEADAATLLAKQVGQDAYDQMMVALANDWFHARQDDACWLHNDCHVFNILVEPSTTTSSNKPAGGCDKNGSDSTTTTTFGERGDFVLVDWEMTIVGGRGKDVGHFQSFPIACALCHAAHGHKEAAYHLLDCNIEFWDCYAAALLSLSMTTTDQQQQEGSNNNDDNKKRNDNDDDLLLFDIFQKSLGNLGSHLFNILYMHNGFMELLPLQGLSERAVRRVRAAYGAIGLRLLCVSSFGVPAGAVSSSESFTSLQELRAFYKNIISESIEELYSSCSSCSSSAVETPTLEPEEEKEDKPKSTQRVVENLTCRPLNDETKNQPQTIAIK